MTNAWDFVYLTAAIGVMFGVAALIDYAMGKAFDHGQRPETNPQRNHLDRWV